MLKHTEAPALNSIECKHAFGGAVNRSFHTKKENGTACLSDGFKPFTPAARLRSTCKSHLRFRSHLANVKEVSSAFSP